MKLTKILLPLATLVAAGAIAVGSGASFTSSTANSISSVTSGTLTQTNSKDDKAIFAADNIKPGDTVTGALTITNTGSLPALFSLTKSGAANGFGPLLTLVITKDGDTTTPVYSGPFDELNKKDLGTVDSKTANTYTFAVTLDDSAGNTLQTKTASAIFTWDSIQETGKTIDTDAKVTPAN